MVYEIKIKPLVYFDVEEAFTWYNQQLHGLGDRFYNHFWSTIEILQATPFVHSYLKKPVRKCKMKKFPFNIHYIIEENQIIILGLVHLKRSNTFIRRRLR